MTSETINPTRVLASLLAQDDVVTVPQVIDAITDADPTTSHLAAFRIVEAAISENRIVRVGNGVKLGERAE